MNIKSSILSAIKKILETKGYTVLGPHERRNLEKTLGLASFRKWDAGTDNGIDSIIFSKDRAMQLNAFLESYFEKVDNQGKLYVLYTCSDKHRESYMQLQKIYADNNVDWIFETDFRKQLIDIIRNSNSRNIIFYVDDMIFTVDVDYAKLEEIDCQKYVLALSRGKNLTYSTVLNSIQKLPELSRYDDNLYEFSWKEIPYLSDWSYPTGVSAYMYDRKELINILENVDFKAPNSLEAAICEFMPAFFERKGLCFEYMACVCIHANIVQQECNNPILGFFSTEELLDLWMNGYKIDCQLFYDIYNSEKIPMTKYQFVKR